MFRDFDHSDEKKTFPSTRINLVTSDMDLRKWPQFRSYQSFFFVLKATGQFAFTDLRLTCRIQLGDISCVTLCLRSLIRYRL